MAFERHSRVRGWLRGMTLAILLVCCASPAQGLAQSTPTTDDAQLTGLVESVLSPPRWFTGSDGNVHLVYELVLTNPLPADVTVTSVDVLDAASGESLTRLEGANLLAAMSLVAQP